MRKNYEKPRPGKLVDLWTLKSLIFLPVTECNLELTISIIGMMFVTFFTEPKMFILQLKFLKYC
jgi:hypothetical protein